MTDARSFVVERTTTIAAPQAELRAVIENLHKWRDWSPWEDLDPDLKRTYSGPDAGVGAHYDWEGNRRAGAGSMTVIASDPDRVAIDLAFRKPFKNRNEVTFLLTPNADATEVVWRMTGRKNWFLTLFGFAFNMDRVVGKDFEKGLAQLKTDIENS